ncbi:MAG: hypothetical protein RLZZ528_554 [Pseudomonadota bacterium]
MAVTLSSLTDLAGLPFDTVVDVRSPAEYAEDHVPGAISLPVLDDDERARVGTIYKQQSPFLARKVGGALVARNAARHIEGSLADKDGAWRPLVYCWRGGQRSGSFASILSQIGWRADTVAGGYKTWRALVVRQVQEMPVAAPVVVLDGNTGSAKTGILLRAAALGTQVLDLEGMANHRGSLFGHMAGGQPSQKAFEGRLAMALAALNPARPVLVEAESSKIGNLVVPKMLWQAMVAAPRITVEVPVAARAEYLVRAYADVTADAARLEDVVWLLRHAHAREVIEGWLALARAGDFRALALDLMVRHYDPRYGKHRARMAGGRDRAVAAADLSEASLDALAGRVVAELG